LHRKERNYSKGNTQRILCSVAGLKGWDARRLGGCEARMNVILCLKAFQHPSFPASQHPSLPAFWLSSIPASQLKQVEKITYSIS
jgi:hypothetical protein